jgi:hypothetical protein
MKPVSIARDLGTVVEMASGVSPSDRVIDGPPDGLINGAVVNVEGAAPKSVAGDKPKSGANHG